MGPHSPGTKLSELKDYYSYPLGRDYKTLRLTNFQNFICGMRKSVFVSIRYAEHKTDRHMLNTSQSFLSLFYLYSIFMNVRSSHCAICFSDTFTRIIFYSIMKYQILSMPSFGGEVKPSVPCRRFATCKRSLNLRGSRNLGKITGQFLAHNSTFRC